MHFHGFLRHKHSMAMHRFDRIRSCLVCNHITTTIVREIPFPIFILHKRILTVPCTRTVYSKFSSPSILFFFCAKLHDLGYNLQWKYKIPTILDVLLISCNHCSFTRFLSFLDCSFSATCFLGNNFTIFFTHHYLRCRPHRP